MVVLVQVTIDHRAEGIDLIVLGKEFITILQSCQAAVDTITLEVIDHIIGRESIGSGDAELLTGGV